MQAYIGVKMIKSKKIAVAAVLCAFAAQLSFAQEVSFENKLSSELVNINISDAGTKAEFAGFTNKTKAEYTSDNLDMGIELKFNLSKDNDAISVGAEEFIDDYFIEVRPIDLLGIGFHKGYAVAGSYLPCLDKEIEASNIGSDFGVFVRPIDGLVISGGLDFISYFGREGAAPLFNFGAEYALGETLTFGAAFRNIASEERSIGAYASYTGISGLTLNAGFTYNGEIEDFNISGNLINAAAMFNKGSLGLYADAVVALGGEKDDANELYTAVNACYFISETLFANLYGCFTNDFDNEDSWCIGVSPSVGFMINENNTVGAGVYINLMKAMNSISIPVYWKYTF